MMPTNDKLTKLINRKLKGDALSESEFSLLHIWMMKNDKDYSNSVDAQLKKDLEKYVPKGTSIK